MLTPASVLALQRSAGNHATTRILQRKPTSDGLGGPVGIQLAPDELAPVAVAPMPTLQRRETGSGLDDPLYMEDREWSSGQGPDDRVTGQRLRNWAINRGGLVVHSEDALRKMLAEDGAEPAIVEEIYLLLIDLLRGVDPGRTSHIQVEGERTPYPVAGAGIPKKLKRLERFKGSDNARERGVLELMDSWDPIRSYLESSLTRRFNTELLDAYGRTPKKDMELETTREDIVQLRARHYVDVWNKGYAPFGGTNTWRVGDRVGNWKVAGISERPHSSFWAVLDRHPLWYYRGALSMLGSQDVFVQKVAAGVADQAKFAGMLWPMMIKGAGFAASFSPVPAIMIAGAVFEAFGDEGIRDLTGEGRSFRDVSGETARQIVIDLALNRLFGGAGKVAGGGTDAARALERAVEASAFRVREAVKEGIEKSEGADVVNALSAGGGHKVADAKLRGEGFVDEVQISHGGGPHTFRRKRDGTWCRWSDLRLCGLKLPKADNLLGPPRTGEITSDMHPKYKDRTVYDVKQSSTEPSDLAEVRMARLWERNGHEVHWNANDRHGDFRIDGVATDAKLLTQTQSIVSAVRRGNSQGTEVIIDGTQVALTRQDTERLIAEFQKVVEKHPGPYRNIRTIHVVEGNGTIYVHHRDTALRVKDPDKPKVREAAGDKDR